VVVAITGASGAIYAQALLAALVGMRVRVHLTMTEAGARLLREELGIRVNIEQFPPSMLVPGAGPFITYHHHTEIGAPLASGGFETSGMVIVPCSMNTLGAVASGLGRNLIERAAAVTLKERRPLVIVPRETPLSAIMLENMLRLAQAGACVLPTMPGFYAHPRTIADLVNFVVQRIIAHLSWGR
jgi:4-hydroxy-3-polyprenylbenzoate decarboxylase